MVFQKAIERAVPAEVVTTRVVNLIDCITILDFDDNLVSEYLYCGQPLKCGLTKTELAFRIRNVHPLNDKL